MQIPIETTVSGNIMLLAALPMRACAFVAPLHENIDVSHMAINSWFSRARRFFLKASISAYLLRDPPKRRL
jgi:hypothetical protein